MKQPKRARTKCGGKRIASAMIAAIAIAKESANTTIKPPSS